MNVAELDWFGLTDVGLKRSENEDQFCVASSSNALRIESNSLVNAGPNAFSRPNGKILVVADGVCGAAAGRDASAIAVTEFVNFTVNRLPRGKDNATVKQLSSELVEASRFCQQRVLDEVEGDAEKRGMATTLTGVVVDWPNAHIAHVGDSRCFLHRAGCAKQLTRDHTSAEVFVQDGCMTESEARESPWSHALWNVIGGSKRELVTDVLDVELATNDTLLLCTDGLTAYLSADELSESLNGSRTAKEPCVKLVETAEARGGAVNITVIVARFGNTDPSTGASREAARRDGMFSFEKRTLPSPRRQFVDA